MAPKHPMTRLAAALAVVLIVLPSFRADSPSAMAQVAGDAHPSGDVVHHYTIDGAIRPLLLFWMSRSHVGAATITWRHAADETEYSLLIGTDPSRAPRNLNRWGYADERLRGSDATILGLMTRSDEQSLEEAKANVKNAEGQPQAFRVIRESVSGGVAHAAVTTLGSGQHYTFKQLDEVLAKVPPASALDHSRSLTLPAGTEPGFLSAVSRSIDRTLAASPRSGDADPPPPIQYVYYGKLYRLRMTEVKPRNAFVIDNRNYRHLLDATFEIHNLETGGDTDFEITYGTEGALRGIPVIIHYQPRWWLRLTLRLTDVSSS
jgi:hypothetical protein